MTHRERAVAAMRGHMPDRLPFIGRMELWYDYAAANDQLPAKYRGWALPDIQRDLDIGVFGFGAWTARFFALEHEGLEIETTESDLEKVQRYHTPYGTLQTRFRLTRELIEADVRGMQVEYAFKGPQDYDALRYLIEHTRVVDRLDEYGRLVDEIGEDGVALPFTGYVPMHQLMHSYMGYETFYLEQFDRPERVERVHELLHEQQREVLRLATHCPVDAIEVGGNYDETMTPPPVFEQHFKPFYLEAAQTLGRAGKVLSVHGDGDMRRLLELIPEAGIQMVEALTPRPMTSIDLRHVRDLWRDRVTIWGGIPAIVLTPTYTDAQFRQFVEDLWDAIAPGDRFILGFGDNVPTDAVWPRIEWLARFVAEHSELPLG